MILYIDNLTGNDTNDGSDESPLACIDAAGQKASATTETEIILIPTGINYEIYNDTILSKPIYMHSKNFLLVDIDVYIGYVLNSSHRYQYLNFNFHSKLSNNISFSSSSTAGTNSFENCRLIDKIQSVIWKNSVISFKNCVIREFTGLYRDRPCSVNVTSSACENVAFINCFMVSDQYYSKNSLFVNSPCQGYPSDSTTYLVDDATPNEYVNMGGVTYGAFLYFKKCLLLQDGYYYSVNSKFYANGAFTPLTVTDLADSIETDGFYGSDLVVACNINGDIFVPLTKFKNFKLVTSSKSNILMKGIKNKYELVVASDDIDMTIVRNIDKFTIAEAVKGFGKIKLVLSIDKGDTWLTWDNTSLTFVPLPVSISKKKDFSTLTGQEKTDWYNAAKEIINNGIDCNTFNTLDFNLVKTNSPTGKLENMRFAYALERPSYPDNATTNSLKWQFDAMGTMRLMTGSECQIDISGRKVYVKSLINSQIVKINTLV